MHCQHRLNEFPLIATRNPDELTSHLAAAAGATRVDVSPIDGQVDARVNFRKLSNTSLFYSTFGAPLKIAFPECRFFKLQIVLKGTAEVTAHGEKVQLTPLGCAGISSNQEVLQNNSADLAHLLFRIDSQRMIDTFEGLIGAHTKTQLMFCEPVTFFGKQAAGLQRLMHFLVTEVEAAEQSLHPSAFAELEQALIVAWLCEARHNFSHLLDREPHAVAPWQVRRAEALIAANWQRPILIDDLAREVGTSVRSLFRSFKQSRGFGPMVFLKRLRLEHARDLLRRGDADATVTGIALSCGFRNLGHFAAEYRRAFQELPSETLSRATWPSGGFA